MQLNTFSFHRRSRGFTLLEVLVALVVLSIGLLGLSGMQTTSLRNNHSAFLRSQATVVTNDILDRMRANRDSAAAGDYDIAYSGNPLSPVCAGGTGCSPTDVARINLAEWRAYVGRLPEGEGEITVVQVPVTIGATTFNVDVAEVKVCWADTRGAGSTIPCSNANSSKLQLVTRAQI